jgi:hypothetical protein
MLNSLLYGVFIVKYIPPLSAKELAGKSMAPFG